MGHDLVAAYPAARRVFEEADDRLGMGLGQLCFEGPAETLRLTEFAQPAILAASIAAFRVLHETVGLQLVAVAGHSLGEWTALVVAGALSLGDAVVAVRERGRLMQEAVPAGTGAMAALLGIEAEQAEALCAVAAQGQSVTPANFNGAGQVVVAGHTDAVDRVLAAASERKIRGQRLPVSAPFHCPLMAPAAERLGVVLEGISFTAPQVPVVSSVDAARLDPTADLRALLRRQVTAPVRWEATMRVLADVGASRGVEVGPGRTLATLAKRIVPAFPMSTFGEAKELDEVARVLG
jgi:[acyl-carrier-protein] S-malonyltransferase